MTSFVVIPAETPAQFVERAERKLGTIPVKLFGIQEIREALDPFTGPDPIYKSEVAAHEYLDGGMGDFDAFKIVLSIASLIAKNSRIQIGTACGFDVGATLLAVLYRTMVGLWLDHEKIPIELVEKAYRYLGQVEASWN